MKTKSYSYGAGKPSGNNRGVLEDAAPSKSKLYLEKLKMWGLTFLVFIFSIIVIYTLTYYLFPVPHACPYDGGMKP